MVRYWRQKEAEEDDFEADVDEDEEAEAERGQIYQLGEHRLMCGDATEEGDVESLWTGRKRIWYLLTRLMGLVLKR